jgi:hypothetical protein
MARLDGKLGIITGAGSGISQVTATLLLERGAVVIISNIDGPAAESVACGIKERGLFAVPTTTDIDADLLTRVLRVDVSGALLGAKQGARPRRRSHYQYQCWRRPLSGTGPSDVQHIGDGHYRHDPQYRRPIRQAGGFVRWP